MDKALLQLVYNSDGRGMPLYVLITCVIAAVLSFVIGLERHLRGEHGIKIHVLLAVGSCLLMILSIWAIRLADTQAWVGGKLNYDTARIAAAVINGIGFLGAGVIVKDKFSVRGLSTASTLWICVAIGMACGAGFVLEAIIVALLVLLILILLGFFLDKLDFKRPHLMVKAPRGVEAVKQIKDVCYANEIQIRDCVVTAVNEQEVTIFVSFNFRVKQNTLVYLSAILANIDGIQVVE